MNDLVKRLYEEAQDDPSSLLWQSAHEIELMKDYIKRLEKLLSEARDVIRDEVEDNYPWRHEYPTYQTKYEMDMDIVKRIDAALEITHER